MLTDTLHSPSWNQDVRNTNTGHRYKAIDTRRIPYIYTHMDMRNKRTAATAAARRDKRYRGWPEAEQREQSTRAPLARRRALVWSSPPTIIFMLMTLALRIVVERD